MHALEDSSALGYRFRDAGLLQQALTHRSHSQPHNERLEFIGDSVLNCVIAEALYLRMPGIPEGDLSRLRARVVNQDNLEQRARALGIGAHLLLGEGELRSGGADRPSILADALEALIGAVFLDGGFEAARTTILALFAESLAQLDGQGGGKDPKTELQEWLQARRKALPEYTVLTIGGEAHRQVFAVECRVAGLGIATRGEGRSRRAAEQVAARQALDQITQAGTA